MFIKKIVKNKKTMALILRVEPKVLNVCGATHSLEANLKADLESFKLDKIFVIYLMRKRLRSARPIRNRSIMPSIVCPPATASVHSGSLLIMSENLLSLGVIKGTELAMLSQKH